MRSRHANIAYLSRYVDESKYVQIPERKILEDAPHETVGMVLANLRPYVFASPQSDPLRASGTMIQAATAAAPGTSARVNNLEWSRITRSMARAAAAAGGASPATETAVNAEVAPTSESVDPQGRTADTPAGPETSTARDSP